MASSHYFQFLPSYLGHKYFLTIFNPFTAKRNFELVMDPGPISMSGAAICWIKIYSSLFDGKLEGTQLTRNRLKHFNGKKRYGTTCR